MAPPRKTSKKDNKKHKHWSIKNSDGRFLIKLFEYGILGANSAVSESSKKHGQFKKCNPVFLRPVVSSLKRNLGLHTRKMRDDVEPES